MKLVWLASMGILAQLLVGCAKKDSSKADIVLINGRVWTGVDPVAYADALAIKGNLISYVGSSQEVNHLVGDKTKVVDLNGKLVIPGFNDAHIHFLWGSVSLAEVNLTGASSVEEVIKRIKNFAKENPHKKWIMGGGWQYSLFADGLPKKEILDSALIDKPVFLNAYDGHAAWTNSLALRAAGVDKYTRFDGFGEIVRNSKGEPAGVFKEKAASLIAEKIPELSRDEKLNALRRGLKLAASLGITSIGNASGSIEELSLYKQLLKNHELNVRLAAALSINANTTQQQMYSYKKIKDSLGDNQYLTARNVKFVLDGTIESHTASMLEPYSNLAANEKNARGTLSMPLETYRALVLKSDSLGFQIYTHAIGDRAVREALNAYEKTPNKRHRIEHIESINASDIPRFKELGVLPSMQPIHADPSTVSVWEKSIGEKRLPYSFAWSSILKANDHLVFASDWPACIDINPIHGLHIAVTRKTPEGSPDGGWLPQQKISILQAVKAYTLAGAYSSGEENIKGKIAPGYLADVIVLSQDIFSVAATEIHNTKVNMTVFDGKIIYERTGPTPVKP